MDLGTDLLVFKPVVVSLRPEKHDAGSANKDRMIILSKNQKILAAVV